MKISNLKNWLNWKQELNRSMIQADEYSGNCSGWGAFITEQGVSSFKTFFSSSQKFQIAPLEHFHTILIDEKYQHHEFINWKTEYWKMRKDLIEMIFSTGKKLRQTQSTAYLAISYMDIILNTVNLISQTLPPHSFKMIAVVWLNIASKFDALDLNTPIINELQRASGCSIVYTALLKYEAEVLQILNWNLK